MIVTIEQWRKALLEKQSNNTEDLYERKFSKEKREELAKAGHALPDGSFPIVTKQDLKNAIKAHGRATDPEKAKRFIKKRAKELGETDILPEEWKGKKKTNESVINESTDFIMNYATELKDAVKQLKEICTMLQNTESQEKHEEIWAVINGALKQYDTNLPDLFDKMPIDINADMIVRFATQNEQRWGTEKQMPIYAIGDVYGALMRKGFLTSAQESQDENKTTNEAFGDMAEFTIGAERSEDRQTVNCQLMIHNKVIASKDKLPLFDKTYKQLFDYCINALGGRKG